MFQARKYSPNSDKNKKTQSKNVVNMRSN